MEKDAKMEVEIHQQYKTVQKNITKHDAKMKRPKAPDPKVLMDLACRKR